MGRSGSLVFSAIMAICMLSTDGYSRRDRDREAEDRPSGLLPGFTATYLDTLNEGKEMSLMDSDLVAISSASQPSLVSTPTPQDPKPEINGELTEGFRIQCFASSNIESVRAEKRTVAKAVRLETYIVFIDPYYKLYAGDFISREDAERQLSKVKRAGFPQAWIVRSTVNKAR